jgi:hypothetical protein
MRIDADSGYNAAGKPRKAYCDAHSQFANREPAGSAAAQPSAASGGYAI